MSPSLQSSFLNFFKSRFLTVTVLTNRLRVMQTHGLLEREVLPSNPPQVEYSLTPLSRELEPILDSMEQVARRLRR